MWACVLVTVTYFHPSLIFVRTAKAYPSETPFWKFAFLVLSFKITLKLKWTVETGPLVYIYNTQILNTVNASVQLKD